MLRLVNGHGRGGFDVQQDGGRDVPPVGPLGGHGSAQQMWYGKAGLEASDIKVNVSQIPQGESRRALTIRPRSTVHASSIRDRSRSFDLTGDSAVSERAWCVRHDGPQQDEDASDLAIIAPQRQRRPRLHGRSTAHKAPEAFTRRGTRIPSSKPYARVRPPRWRDWRVTMPVNWKLDMMEALTEMTGTGRDPPTGTAASEMSTDEVDTTQLRFRRSKHSRRDRDGS